MMDFERRRDLFGRQFVFGLKWKRRRQLEPFDRRYFDYSLLRRRRRHPDQRRRRRLHPRLLCSPGHHHRCRYKQETKAL